MNDNQSKDKALELCQEFGWLGTKWEQTEFNSLDLENAKQCALIAVREIISVIRFMSESSEPDKLPYWENVKKEIEKL